MPTAPLYRMPKLPAQAQPIPRRKKAKGGHVGLHRGRMRHADRGAQGAFRRAGDGARGVRCPLMPEPAQIALGQPSPAAHDGRRLRHASSEKKAVRPPSGYPYDPSGYGACFGAKWRLPGRAGAGRCRRTAEKGAGLASRRPPIGAARRRSGSHAATRWSKTGSKGLTGFGCLSLWNVRAWIQVRIIFIRRIRLQSQAWI